MFVKLLIVFLFLSNNAIASPAAPHPQDAVITAGPKLDIRQQVAVTDPRFMGWEVVGGSIYQRTCSTGLTYSVSNNHFNCCPTFGLCSFATACAGISTALFATPSVFPYQCPTACVTGSLYWSTDDTRPYTFVGCGTGNYWVVQSSDSSGLLSWTPGVAVVVPATTAPFSTITSISSNSAPTTQPTTTTLPGTTSPPPATSSSSGGGGSSSNNGAIIGGAIGGGAIAVGLIILGILLFLRRKRNSNGVPPPVSHHPQGQQPYPNQPQQDMRPMSYIPPGSPPPPWDGQHAQYQGMMGQKQTYQYETVAKDDPNVQVVPHSPQPPHAYEMQGTPATHPMELQGAQR